MEIYSVMTLPHIARVFVYYFKKLKEEKQSLWETVEKEASSHIDVACNMFFTRKYTATLKPGQPYVPCFCKFIHLCLNASHNYSHFSLVLLLQQLENIERYGYHPKKCGNVNQHKLELLAYVIDDIMRHRVSYEIEADANLQKFFREDIQLRSQSELCTLLTSTDSWEKASRIKTESIHTWERKVFFRITQCNSCSKILMAFHQGLQCKGKDKKNKRFQFVTFFFF